MSWKTVLVFGLPLVGVLILLSIDRTAAQTGAVIDFEGLPAGTIVDTLSSGNGISGEFVEGVVTVFGKRADLGLETNTAMIFDATCPPGFVPADCTGGDGDLFKPDLGKVLIISEDLDSSDPDDADLPGSFFRFDYSNWGTGKVTVESLHVMDVEEDQNEGDAHIELYSGGLEGTLLAVVDIPDTGNNGLALVPIGVSGVDFMRVTTNGSGAIDNINIFPDQLPTETPTPTSTLTPTTTSSPTPTITPTQPTAVELVDFWVNSVFGQKVALSWTTAAEIDNQGFRIYRADVADIGKAELIGFVSAKGNPGGNQYSYEDHAPQGGYWWYWVADVDGSGGETLHGPLLVETVVFDETIYLPMLVLP